MSEPPIDDDPVIIPGWEDAAKAAESNAKGYADTQDETVLYDAKGYTDEQIPAVAGRMVPRSMDRAPTVADGENLIVGTGWNEYDATGDLVQMWRWDGTVWRALDMSPGMVPVLDIGSATVGDLTGGRINVAEGPIIAGDPDGARVELTGDGFHAYDASGTETARIQGEGGEFVGGEFRTSDNRPGQVTLSDTAVEGLPGVQVKPADTTGYTAFPGVTHSHTGMMMWGGRDTTDRESEATLRPDRVYLRSRGGGDPTSEADILVTEGVVRLRSIPDASDPLGDGVRVTLDDRALNIGTRSDTGWSSINVLGTNARIANGAPDGRYTEINTDWASARVVREAADGTRRALVVDDHGVWAETDRDGVQQRYNLEETATMPSPELIPFATGTDWDTVNSPVNGILVTHSATGRSCRSRFRLNRRGTDLNLDTSYQNIGQFIPDIVLGSGNDYVDVNLPGNIRGELYVSYASGNISMRTLEGTAEFRTGRYVYATLEWFIPN